MTGLLSLTGSSSMTSAADLASMAACIPDLGKPCRWLCFGVLSQFLSLAPNLQYVLYESIYRGPISFILTTFAAFSSVV
jgi:hypothetical protein